MEKKFDLNTRSSKVVTKESSKKRVAKLYEAIKKNGKRQGQKEKGKGEIIMK